MVMGETESTMPVTNFERGMAVLCFMIGGAVYAYVIGSVCSIISERDPASKMYHEVTESMITVCCRFGDCMHVLCFAHWY
jgi:hypothetical protein